MLTETDLWPLFTEGTDSGKQDLSFESFEKDIGEIEFDLSFFQFPDNFPILPYTPPVITTPSSLTYSTDSDSPSQYSYSFAPSDYSSPSDILTPGPVDQCHDVYTTHDSVYPDVFSHDPSSFGSLPPSPPLRPVKAHSDHGTSLPHQFFEISPEELCLALRQSATLTSPKALPALPDTRTDTTSARPFKCPLCPFASKRKYNLNTHIGTHDKEKSKRFRCGTCHRRFSRKHDLQRHLPRHHAMHGGLTSTSSTYSGSAVDSGLTASFTEEDIMAYFQVE